MNIKNEWLQAIEFKSVGGMEQIVNGRTVKGIPSVFGNVDDGNDRMRNGVFKKSINESLNRVRFLWNHDYTQPPVAVIRNLKEISRADLPSEIKSKFPEATGGLEVEREYLDTPRGNEILTGLNNGAINEMSVGFNTIQKSWLFENNRNVRDITEGRLLDISDVPWGMNPATLAKKSAAYEALWGLASGQDILNILMAGQQLNDEDLAQLVSALQKLMGFLASVEPSPNIWAMIDEAQKALPVSYDKFAGIWLANTKGAIPFKATPTADKSTAWDAGEQTKGATPETLKAICAWYDSAKPDLAGSYKLPHHEASGDHRVVWNGVKAAMGALMGARGGVDIPEADKHAVYEHLAKHYKEFDETPPDYKAHIPFLETANQVRLLIPSVQNLKIGKQISSANQDKLKAVIESLENGLETLESLLEIAEPPDEEAAEDTAQKALTNYNALKLRVEIASREIGV